MRWQSKQPYNEPSARCTQPITYGTKLTGIGTLQGASEGPVARAAGHASDARHGDGVYDELGFEPITQDEGDAMARLRQRCAEIAKP